MLEFPFQDVPPDTPVERDELTVDCEGGAKPRLTDLGFQVLEPGRVAGGERCGGANFAEPITLAELSLLAGLSLHRFVTVFREQVGIPPHQFVCRTRVDQARALLRQGLPLAAVAADTGFCDQSHMSRHFKRIHGTTPGGYLHSLGGVAA